MTDERDMHATDPTWNPHELLGGQFRPLTSAVREAAGLPPTRNAESILEEAARITAGDRQRYYGHPTDNHGNTAELWSAYLSRAHGFDGFLTARDVCLMMILLKISRDANRPHRDNLVDICGYARNAEQVVERSATGGDFISGQVMPGADEAEDMTR